MRSVFFVVTKTIDSIICMISATFMQHTHDVIMSERVQISCLLA
jgi:hypothetical protein